MDGFIVYAIKSTSPASPSPLPYLKFCFPKASTFKHFIFQEINLAGGGLSYNWDRRMVVETGKFTGIFFIEGERCPRPSSDPNMRVIPSLHGTHEADTVNRSLGSRSRGTTSSLYSPSCLSRRNLLQVRTPTPARTMVRIMVPETVLTTRRMLPDSVSK